jgi:hypothetical protein
MTAPSKPEAPKSKISCWTVLAALVLVGLVFLALDPCTTVATETPAPAGDPQ